MRQRCCGTAWCPGSNFDDAPCNSQSCPAGEEIKETNDWGIAKSFSHHTLNDFQQDCLDYHNFFRALHGLQPLRWDPELFETSKLWSKQLIKVAPENPNQTKMRTQNWPHSDVGSTFRPENTGENIAWDLSPKGGGCQEAVFRWYAERFYYNPANQQSRRPGEPVGHLTQMLWESSTAVGCSRTQKLIKQPPNTYPKFQRSSYTVCHYYPQGNIIGLMEENWKPLKKKYTSTYDINTGRNMCGPFGTGQGLDKNTKCGCKRRSTGKVVPLCIGRCLIECRNQWGTANYYPKECMGRKFCTCSKKGAYCK